MANEFGQQVKKVLSAPFVLLVRIYQYTISPLFPATCRHTPTCSQFTIEALQKHGPIKGLWMGLWRLMHCHPWGTHGHDPVPDKFKLFRKLPHKLKLLGLVLLFMACQPADSEKKQLVTTITVSIPPQAYVLNKLLPDSVATINVLLEENNNPEMFEPTTKQVKALKNSELMIINGGLDFEIAWQEKIKQAHSNLRIVNAGDSIDGILGHSHHHGDHQHHFMDPHYWVSPKSFLQALPAYYHALLKLGIDSIDLTQRYNVLQHEILKTDSVFTVVLSGAPKKDFIIYHPALSYIARDYYLQQHSLENEGKEPTMAHLQHLKTLALQKEIQTVLVQQQFDTTSAAVLARDLNAQLVTIDPLQDDLTKVWADVLIGLKRSLYGE